MFPKVAQKVPKAVFWLQSDVFHLAQKVFEDNLSPKTLKIAQSGHTGNN